MYTQLQELVEQSRKGNPVVCTALIGIVAFNIIKKTLYSLLWLLIKQKMIDLSTTIL